MWTRRRSLDQILIGFGSGSNLIDWDDQCVDRDPRKGTTVETDRGLIYIEPKIQFQLTQPYCSSGPTHDAEQVSIKDQSTDRYPGFSGRSRVTLNTKTGLRPPDTRNWGHDLAPKRLPFKEKTHRGFRRRMRSSVSRKRNVNEKKRSKKGTETRGPLGGYEKTRG